MKKGIAIFFLIFLCATFLSAHERYWKLPFDSLLNRTHIESQIYQGYIFEDMIRMDAVHAMIFLDSIKCFAKERQQTKLELFADFFKVLYSSGYHNPSLPQDDRLKDPVKSFYTIAERAKETGCLEIEAEAICWSGYYAWTQQKNYEKAFNYYERGYKLLQKTSDDYANKAHVFDRIANSYIHFRDYERAILIYKEAARCKTPFHGNNNINVMALNSVGLCFRELAQLDSSDYYFNVVYDFKETQRHKEWQWIAKSNLGYNLVLRGKPEQAVTLIQGVVDETKGYHDIGFLIKNSLWLADIYLSQKDAEKARPYIEDAEMYFSQVNWVVERSLFYPVLSKYYALTGRGKLAVTYMDSATLAKKMHDNEFNSILLLRIDQKELAQREAQLKQEKAQKRITEDRLKWVAIMSLLILLLLVIYIFLYRQKVQAYRELIRKSREWAKMPVVLQEDDFIAEADKAIANEGMSENKDELLILLYQMKNLIETQSLYKNPELTVGELAEMLDVSKHHLSMAGNSLLDKNFKSFINEYRIKESIRLMTDPAYEQESLDAIALDSGFNNRITFFRVFKKVTGVSPSTFRKNKIKEHN